MSKTLVILNVIVVIKMGKKAKTGKKDMVDNIERSRRRHDDQVC